MKKWLLFSAVAAAMIVAAGGCRPKAKVTIPTQKGLLFEGDQVPGGGIPLGENPEGPFVDPEDYTADPAVREIFVDVHFDYNKAEIRAGERPILERIAGYMREHGALTIKVEGHCDERGSNEYNLALGERRALSIRSYIAGLGIEPGRIFTISYGEEKPLCTESRESCWQRNRRGHFLLGLSPAQAPRP